MAKEEEKQEEQEQKTEKGAAEEKPQAKAPPQAEAAVPVEKQPVKSGFGLFTWLILAAIVGAGFVGGFSLAQLLAGTNQQVQNKQANTEPEKKTFDDLIADNTGDKKVWSHDLETVIANLDEPGITRFARISITLELSPEMDQKNGTLFLEEKELILRDWLTTYIAGLSLERVRGTSNLTRIKKEIRDQFNEILFAETKPFIINILFKDFAIQ